MNILVVDDSPVTLSALTELLAMDGHEVESAANGHAAMVKLAVYRPDVVLMDMVMPHIDGMELITCMRDNPAWRSIPVVVMTALSDRMLAEELTRLPDGVRPTAVVQKPVDLGTLKGVIREVSKMTV